jgi:hypothetical protein
MESEKEDILKDLHVSGEQSAHSAGEDHQPSGLRGLCSSRSGSLAGIVQGGQKKTTFSRTSMCPANSRPIALVRTGNLQDYEHCVLAAQEAWQV